MMYDVRRKLCLSTHFLYYRVVMKSPHEHMDRLLSIFSGGTLHHAYLIEGGASTTVVLQKLITDKLSVATRGNPDFLYLQSDVFTIDDARHVREAQTMKAIGTFPYKIFLIETETITIEAQNALLKIFEEPTANTHFFLVIPTRWLLLPTVISRLYVIGGEPLSEARSDISPSDFLAATITERLNLVTALIEKKDKTAAFVFIDSLIQYVHYISSQEKYSILSELIYARRYLNDRAASLKIILEHLALTIPPLV